MDWRSYRSFFAAFFTGALNIARPCSQRLAWRLVSSGHKSEKSSWCRCGPFAGGISGYRAWERGGTKERKQLTDAQMLALIRAIYAELKGAYGSPRITKELRMRGFAVSKARIELDEP